MSVDRERLRFRTRKLAQAQPALSWKERLYVERCRELQQWLKETEDDVDPWCHRLYQTRLANLEAEIDALVVARECPVANGDDEEIKRNHANTWLAVRIAKNYWVGELTLDGIRRREGRRPDAPFSHALAQMIRRGSNAKTFLELTQTNANLPRYVPRSMRGAWGVKRSKAPTDDYRPTHGYRRRAEVSTGRWKPGDWCC